MTLGEFRAFTYGLPDDTGMEIHTDACSCKPRADYDIGAITVVSGSENPMWINISTGEFITNC